MKPEPLDKLVATRTGWSRRLAARAVRGRRITVDGEALADPRVRVDPTALLHLDGAPLAAPPRLALWHKPIGVQCSTRDNRGRPTLWTEAPDLLTWGLRPVGRLDADTSGLLLFTADGQLTQRLLHPKRGVPRTYVARVQGTPGPPLIDALAVGVATAAGVFAAEGVTIDGDQVTLTVREGKHRMVRRMLNNAGHPVNALCRIAFGPFVLGALAPGTWREPLPDEEAALASL